MRAFKIVDVFTSEPLQGNPVAVVLQADGLTQQQMQQIAAWTNLSETTFHLSPTDPDADYRLRIFTPRSELPFAGHPTLGSAHALIEAGLISPVGDVVVQECSIGLVPVSLDREAGALRLRMPPAQLRDLAQDEQDRLAEVLGAPLAAGCRPMLVDVGARWIVAELADAEAVIRLEPDLSASAQLERDLEATGISVFGRHASGPDQIEVRSFAPSCGISEDPVCGSGNGAIAAYRLDRGDLMDGAAYRAAQGRCVNRAGQISLRIEGNRIFVGGLAVTTVEGRIAAS